MGKLRDALVGGGVEGARPLGGVPDDVASSDEEDGGDGKGGGEAKEAGGGEARRKKALEALRKRQPDAAGAQKPQKAGFGRKPAGEPPSPELAQQFVRALDAESDDDAHGDAEFDGDDGSGGSDSDAS